MERNPLLALLIPVAVVGVAFLGITFVLGGLGGVLVLATLAVIAGCLLSRLDWRQDDLAVPSDLFPFDTSPLATSSMLAESVAPADGIAAAVPVADLREWQPAVASRSSTVFAGQGIRFNQRAIGYAITAAVAVLLCSFMVRGLATNPVALFCDEAEIGLEAWRFLHRQAEVTPIPLFYDHFAYQNGSLPVLWTAPFVALFGLDDVAMRLAAVVPILLMLVVIYVTLRRLKTPFAVVAVAVYGFSPLVIHLSRANFGHGPSLLLIALGFDRFVLAWQTGKGRPAIIGGLMLGASIYGNPSMLIVTPLILGSIALSEVVFNRRRIAEYRTIGLTFIGALTSVSPQIYRAVFTDDFWARFDGKNLSGGSLLSTDRAASVLDNYGKYFNLDYLFRTGEIGMPNAFVTRHSVPGAGELNALLLPLVVLGFATLILRWRQPEVRYFFPWFVVAVLYPAPDVLTTTSQDAPYTVALFGTFMCLPYVAGHAMYGVRELAGWVTDSRHNRAEQDRANGQSRSADSTRGFQQTLATMIAGFMLLWVVISGWQFYTGPYENYPNVSADYWGWQYGAEPMIQYFLDHQDEYDEFIMDGNFNQAYVFLDFYIRDPEVRSRASIGDISRLDLTKRQLFGVRKSAWDELAGSQFPPKSYMVIDTIVLYPNGTEAMYLLELR